LADAGYPNGAGFPVVQLWTVSRAESTKTELAAYQRYLAELGVKVDIHFATEWTRYTEMLRRGELPMFRYAWYADLPDPDNILFPLLHSSSLINYGAYGNSRVDELLEQARKQLDYAHRIALYREVERIVMGDAPWITQHNHVFEYLYQPYVQGVELNLLGDRWIPMKQIWLKNNRVESSTDAIRRAQTRR
jgi:oligopeptide transport system substrate-binding protein